MCQEATREIADIQAGKMVVHDLVRREHSSAKATEMKNDAPHTSPSAPHSQPEPEPSTSSTPTSSNPTPLPSQGSTSPDPSDPPAIEGPQH